MKKDLAITIGTLLFVFATMFFGLFLIKIHDLYEECKGNDSETGFRRFFEPLMQSIRNASLIGAWHDPTSGIYWDAFFRWKGEKTGKETIYR